MGQIQAQRAVQETWPLGCQTSGRGAKTAPNAVFFQSTRVCTVNVVDVVVWQTET